MPEVLSQTDLQKILSRLKEHLQEIYGDRFSKMILFGSQARGEATTDSDIDVLIVLKGEVDFGAEVERTAEFVSNLCLDFDQVIGSFFMAEQDFISRNSPLLINVRREGIAI
jgi:predicted nucleotidyltransferase